MLLPGSPLMSPGSSDALLKVLRCPSCLTPFETFPKCRCGFEVRVEDGILNLLTPREDRVLGEFCREYEKVRLAEGWGVEDLDLPFHPKDHQGVWDIRRHSFKKLKSVVFNRWGEDERKGLAVDVGAGNCWLTRYLESWGFDAVAVDINASRLEGLRTGEWYLERGAHFERIRAAMESLPFQDGSIRLLVANQSFHYSRDPQGTLKEFRRVLEHEGVAVLLDSPFYNDAPDGERMVAERVALYVERYGVPEDIARQAGYETYTEMKEMTAAAGLRCEVRPVWPGFRRMYDGLCRQVSGRRVAEFPIVVLTPEA